MQATYLALILAVAISGSVSTQADLRHQSWANNYGEDLNFECPEGVAINAVAVSYDMNISSSTTSSTTFSSSNSTSIIHSNNDNSPRFKLACRATVGLSSNCKWTDGSKRSFPPSCPDDDKGWAVTGLSISHSDSGSVVNTKCCAFSDDYEVLPNATCHMIWVDQYVTERTLRDDEIVQGVDVIQTSNSRSQDVYIFKVCAFIKKPTPTTSATSERRQESTSTGHTPAFLKTTRNAVITPRTTMTIIEGVTPYMTTYTDVMTKTAMMITTDVTRKTPTTTTSDTIREIPTMTNTDVMTKTPTVTTTDVTTKTPKTTTSDTIRETPTMTSTDVMAKSPTMTTIDVMTKTPTVTTTDVTTKTSKTTTSDTIRERPTMTSTDVMEIKHIMTTIDVMTKKSTVTTTDVTTKTPKTTTSDAIRETSTMTSTDVMAKTPTMTTIDVMTKTPTVTTDVTTKTPKMTTSDTIRETPAMTSTDFMTKTPTMTTANKTTKTPPTTTTDTKREIPMMTTAHVMTKTPTMTTTDVTTPTTTTADAVRETPTMTITSKTTSTTTADIKTKAPNMTKTDVIRSTPIMTAMINRTTTTPTRRPTTTRIARKITTTTTDETTTTADFMRKTPTMPADSVFRRTRNMTTTDVTTQAHTTTLTDIITKTPVMTTTRNSTARSTPNTTTSEHAVTGSSDRYQDVSQPVGPLMDSVEMDLLIHRLWLRTNVTFVSNIVWILSQIMDENVTVLSDANMGYRLLSAIDIVGREGLLSTHDHFLTVAPNLAIAAHTVNAPSFAGLVLTAHAREDNRFQRDEVRIFTDTRTVPHKEVSSLVLPASLLTSLSSGSRIATAVHISGKVFEAIERARRNGTWNETVSALTDDNVTKVNSYVMAASVVGHEVMNLKDPVKINFVHIDKNAVSPRCVFWNTSIEEGRGGWSTSGCWRVNPSSTDTRTLCECNHLTSFALLMDVYQRGDTVPTLHRQVLSVISYTGCGVSLLALALTILTYCIWNPTSSAKKGNQPKGHRRTIFNKPTMILLNLCTSMALSNLVFVVGLQSYTMRHHWACKVVAMLLHMCLLSSLCWMAVEAFYMYLSLVRVFRTRVTRIMLKCSAFAWGLPLLVVIITAAVDMDNYASLTSGVCWLSGIAFYAAFVAPVGLLLIFNSVIFTLVLRVILTLADNRLERRRSSKAVTQLRRATGVVILLGLTWVFGFMTIDRASLVFYYLFAVFNSFQGLFIFVFYCAFNAEVRAAWKQSCGQWMDGKKQTKKANPEPKATAAERNELLNHPDVKITGSTNPSDPSAATATSSSQTGMTSLDDCTGVALTTTSISTNDRDNANQ